MRLLSPSTSSAWCDGSCRAGWSRRPSRTHRAFGCHVQPTHRGTVEGNDIRLRRPGLGRAVKTVKPRGLSPRHFTAFMLGGTHSWAPRRIRCGSGTCTLQVRHGMYHLRESDRREPVPSQSKLLPARHTVPTGRCRGSRGAAVTRGPTRGRTHALVGTSWWLPAVTPGRHTATPGGSSRCGWVSTASLGTYRRTGDCSMRVLPDCRPPGRPFERNGTTPPTRRRFGPTGPRSRRRTS